MTGLYLIAHKVRGEAAFDIATQLAVGDEIWWIIPTSGHRAYPFWVQYWKDQDHLDEFLPEMPDDLPDHYRVVRKEASRLDEIDLKELGLL